ncbi:MAG: CPBP family intramembrane glutamic endopeptidase, partial [Flavobacteriaceae bacterium]
KWSEFGIEKFNWAKTIFRAIILAVAIFLVIDFLVQPVIEQYFGAIDLSALDSIRGNLVSYIIFIVFMWVVAAFGEEFLYRGFFMKRLAAIMGNTNRAWLISALLISALFGMAHLYQGLSGVITTGLIGFIFSIIFYKNRKNLVLAMLTHGFYDMIGITLIFLDKDRYLIDLIQNAI